MLTTILHNIIPPKCVIIQDSINQQGLNILISMIKNHLILNVSPIHFFCFEIDPSRIKKLVASNNIVFHDFTSNDSWLNAKKQGQFLKFLEENRPIGYIFIDSLAQVVIEYGLGATYKALHEIENRENVLQLAAILHEDVVETNSNILDCFEFLATLKMKLISMSNKSQRVDYIYRKSGGKIIQEIEEYYFSNGDFYTKIIERPNPKVLLANATKEILPEDIASFKISLNEKDKKLKNNFTLPYLKTSEDSNPPKSTNVGGSIIYNFDDNDDWDEEDPDDDLDI